MLAAGYPLAYLRGDSHLVIVNPRRDPATVHLERLAAVATRKLFGDGVHVADGRIHAVGFAHAVFQLITPVTTISRLNRTAPGGVADAIAPLSQTVEP